jgi:hypothetical protein
MMGSMQLDDSILSGREHHLVNNAFKPGNNFRFRGRHAKLGSCITPTLPSKTPDYHMRNLKPSWLGNQLDLSIGRTTRDSMNQA